MKLTPFHWIGAVWMVSFILTGQIPFLVCALFFWFAVRY
jgi:hypothetical protein